MAFRIEPAPASAYKPLTLKEALPSIYLFNQAIVTIHEYGHALAAYLLFENANPQVNIFWSGSGNCTWNSATLSSIGKPFGINHATSLAMSAGPLIEMGALLAITLYDRKRQKNSDVKPLIQIDQRTKATCMIMKAVMASGYALGALFRCSPGHDFCQVWSNSGGIAYGVLAAAILGSCAYIANEYKYDYFGIEERKTVNQTLTHLRRNQLPAGLRAPRYRRSF